MSITIAAVAKKAAVSLLTDKRTWTVIASVIGAVVGLVLLPAIMLMSVTSQLSAENIPEINYNDFVKTLSAEQVSELEKFENDGKKIDSEMRKISLPKQIVKAQMIYFTYFESTPADRDFFQNYCKIFQESDNEKLIQKLNSEYGLSIDYKEFMTSYSMISNVSIDENRFLNTGVKNNFDLAEWAENTYETAWGYVPHGDGNVLNYDAFEELKKNFPDENFEDCDRWKLRRVTDNVGLLQTYLCYDSEDRTINYEEIFFEKVLELFDNSSDKGEISSLPDAVGTVLLSSDSIGIFVGDNNVIYAKSVADGVVKEKISDGQWLHWFQPSVISYGEKNQFSTDIQFEEFDASRKNNLGLVEWAIQAHDNGWGYVYGTYGNILTEDSLAERASVFGGNVTNYMDFIRQNWLGRRTADCVGLITGYGWYDNESGVIRVGSNGMADVTADGMFQAASVKGTIDTIPEVKGLAVWHSGHIGIYIGNGEVIEAMNTLRGVTRTKATPHNLHLQTKTPSKMLSG